MGGRVVPAVPALAALVVGSAVIRVAVLAGADIPWITPDEVLYGLMGESLWETGTLSVRGLPVAYTSLVTPALVGGPLAALGPDHGVLGAQIVQALVMSSAAIPVYLWARRLASGNWALVAAALTLLVPGLAYGGTLMTEAAFYPLAVAALAAAARVLERPTLWRQGVFFGLVALASAVRMQALVLVPTLVLAALLHGVLSRSWRTARSLALLAGIALAATVVAAVVAVAAGGGSPWEDLLGAYQPVLETSTSAGSVLESIGAHAAGIALVGLVVPVVATAVVCAQVAQRRTDGPDAAFAATAVAYVVMLVLQVGAFAAQNVGYLSQRYLLTAAPVLFVGFAAWLGQSAPRPRVIAALTAGVLLFAALLVPIDDVVPTTGIHDSLWTTWLQGAAAGSSTSARVLLVAATVILLGALLLPSRWRAPGAALLVAAGLLALSVDATRTVLRESRAQQRVTIGEEPPAWLPETADDVTLLATGDEPPPTVARTFFWNPVIRSVVRLEDATVTVPPEPPWAEIGLDGIVRTTDGAELATRSLLAPATVTLAGDIVAQRRDPSAETIGWRLWHLDGPPRVTTRVVGMLPNGDFSGEMTVLVPGCAQGALEVTLLGKTGDPVAVRVDGIPWGDIEAPNGTVARERVPAPPYADGSHTCVFTLATDGLVGSTRIEYVPDE